MKGKKLIVIPCSGIGKVQGLIAREAAYEIIENRDIGDSEVVCLPLIVCDDEETIEKIRNNKCITIDGCPKYCAKKNAELAGGKIEKSVLTMDALKNNQGTQPGNATKLTDDGWQIVCKVADEALKLGD